jgi:antitoxin VapB
MTATAKLFIYNGSQAVLRPKEFRFEGKEVRISKVGDKVILEPAGKGPFDAAAWRASLAEFRDIPFMEDGRDQGTIVEVGDKEIREPQTKNPIDLDKFWTELDTLGAKDYLPDGIPDDPPVQPDPRKFFDE